MFWTLNAGRIYKFGADGENLLAFGRYGSGDGEFDMDAADIAIDGRGNVLIADTGNHRIVQFDAAGKFVSSFGRKGRGNGEFTKPMALATLPTGEILVKDASQFRRKIGGLPEIIALSPTLTQLTELTPGQAELADTIANTTPSTIWTLCSESRSCCRYCCFEPTRPIAGRGGIQSLLCRRN